MDCECMALFSQRQLQQSNLCFLKAFQSTYVRVKRLSERETMVRLRARLIIGNELSGTKAFSPEGVRQKTHSFAFITHGRTKGTSRFTSVKCTSPWSSVLQFIRAYACEIGCCFVCQLVQVKFKRAREVEIVTQLQKSKQSQSELDRKHYSIS